MPISLIFMITFFGILFLIFCFLFRKQIGNLAWILLLLMVIGNCVWIGMAKSKPIVIKSVTRHEISTVTYPDGTKKQMFTIDGIHYNANAKWHRLIDENEYEVELVIYVTNYLGIDYSEDFPKIKPQFNLVKKVEK